MTTTILWAGHIDDFSRRVLTTALRVAADEGHPIRIHVFAAAAHVRPRGVVTEQDDKSVSLEVEGSLGVAVR